MENVQIKMENFFAHTCYAYCLCKKFNPEWNLPKMTMAILTGWDKGYLEDDAYVAKPVQFINNVLGGSVKDVQKVFISSLKELPDNGYYIVEYKKTPDSKDSHFVVVYKKKVFFDPSGDSVTVKVGKPFSYRKYI